MAQYNVTDFVLIVDDDGNMRSIVRRMLGDLGFSNLKEFSSAGDALDFLRENPCRLVVSDCRMPGMDGVTFLAHLRAEQHKTPFILMTINPEKEVVVDAISHKVDDFIVKPFSFSDFEQSVIKAFQCKS